MQIRFQPFELQLKHAFGIANFTRTSTPLMLVEIEHDGLIGYGEASMPPYLGESQQTAKHFLSKVALDGFNNPDDIESIMRYVDALAVGNTAAKAAVDIALHDLKGKLNQMPCHKMMGVNPANMPETSCTIGIDTADVIREKIKEAAAFKVLKVKLGSDHDKEIINTIREITNVPLSIDANQGWKDKHYAVDMIHWLSERKVTFIEQPLPKDDVDGNAWVTENSPLPIIADEAMQRLADMGRLKGIYDGINIKLMKCTGMNEAFKMIQEARKLDMKILIGCMTETSCAIMAAAALASLCDWADLDGPWLISNNPYKDPELNEGKLVLNDQAGLGISEI